MTDAVAGPADSDKVHGFFAELRPGQMGQGHLAFSLSVGVMILNRARPVIATINAGRSHYFGEKGALIAASISCSSSRLLSVFLLPL